MRQRLSTQTFLCVSLSALLTVFPAVAATRTNCLDDMMVVGDSRLVQQVEAWRETQSDDTPSKARCQDLRFRIERNGADEVYLELYENEGLKYRRTVARIDTALALLESWVEQEMSDHLLEAERPLAANRQEERKPLMTSPEPSVSTDLTKSQKTYAYHRRMGIWSAAELWLGHDQSTWIGVAAGVTRGIKMLRLGILARYGHGLSRRSIPFTGPNAAAVLMTVDYPLTSGNLSLFPGLGLGGMLMFGPKRTDDRGEATSRDRFGSLQLETYIWAGISISEHFQLGFCSRFTGSLFGETGDVTINGDRVPAQPIWVIRFSLGPTYEW